MKKYFSPICFLLILCGYTFNVDAQNLYTIVHNFSGPTTDGATPFGSLISDNSKLYGMTTYGGAYNVVFYCGTIFSYDVNGSSKTIIHNFAGNGAGNDGKWPHGNLLLKDDKLYGMTRNGGFDNGNYGTIFSVNVDGSDHTILHNCGSWFGHDGIYPHGSLVTDGDLLYGMNTYGGMYGPGFYLRYGTAFSMNTDGTNYQVLHHFDADNGDGKYPHGSLLIYNEKLYGMTREGGENGNGVIFTMNIEGSDYTLLHNFAGQPEDGAWPYGSLIFAGNKFYGTTRKGGLYDKGTVFSINILDDGYTIIHQFSGQPEDGAYIDGDLIVHNGKLYGMTPSGGGDEVGVIFSIDTNGNNHTLLHNFKGPPDDGSKPSDNLIKCNNKLYGMTSDGGSNNAGVIFSFSLAAPQPSATPTPTPLPNEYLILESGDYNGDGTADIAVFRGSSGLWAVRNLTRIYFGIEDDIPVNGDYNGDGTTDVGIFRSDSGLWAIRNVSRAYFGNSSDTPVPLRFNPSSACNIGIFRESTGLWAIKDVTRVYFGTSEDAPVPGDYTGDGTKELGIFRESSGLWALREVSRFYFGQSTDIALPGNYGGEGTCSAAIFRGSSGLWAIRGVTRVYYGTTGDWVVPADYRGDGTTAVGIFRESNGLWAVRGVTRVYYGTTGDIPVIR